MKKFAIVGIMGLFLLSLFIGAYAHSQQNKEYNDYMDEVHEEMIGYIDDPELREAMDDMHEGCERFHGGNRNTIIRSHMI